jgi:hypothetical protein
MSPKEIIVISSSFILPMVVMYFFVKTITVDSIYLKNKYEYAILPPFTLCILVFLLTCIPDQYINSSFVGAGLLFDFIGFFILFIYGTRFDLLNDFNSKSQLARNLVFSLENELKTYESMRNMPLVGIGYKGVPVTLIPLHLLPAISDTENRLMDARSEVQKLEEDPKFNVQFYLYGRGNMSNWGFILILSGIYLQFLSTFFNPSLFS